MNAIMNKTATTKLVSAFALMGVYTGTVFTAGKVYQIRRNSVQFKRLTDCEKYVESLERVLVECMFDTKKFQIKVAEHENTIKILKDKTDYYENKIIESLDDIVDKLDEVDYKKYIKN